MSGSASSTRSTGRSVLNEWRSSAEARTTSTPPGQRARTASSAAARSAVELVTRDQLLDDVRGLLLLVEVRVRLIGDLLLLSIVERAAGVLLDDLVPDGLRRIGLLAAHLAGLEREDVLLDRESRDHPAREPSEIATLVRCRAVLAVLRHDVLELLALVQGLLDVGDLLQLIG